MYFVHAVADSSKANISSGAMGSQPELRSSTSSLDGLSDHSGADGMVSCL